MGVDGRGTQRLFVAVPAPEDLLPFALEAQALLPETRDIRLLDPGQLHVTLAFIGRVGVQKTEAARAVVRAVPVDSGGEACVEGFLLLPSPERARVVTLRLVDPGQVFGRLFELVMAGLERNQVMRREKRPFRAHLTVARLRHPGSVQPMSDCGKARFRVESVCLYESELRREGARYTVIERTCLTAAN
jgi:2'-5' RNA ligase